MCTHHSSTTETFVIAIPKQWPTNQLARGFERGTTSVIPKERLVDWNDWTCFCGTNLKWPSLPQSVSSIKSASYLGKANKTDWCDLFWRLISYQERMDLKPPLKLLDIWSWCRLRAEYQVLIDGDYHLLLISKISFCLSWEAGLWVARQSEWWQSESYLFSKVLYATGKHFFFLSNHKDSDK